MDSKVNSLDVFNANSNRVDVIEHYAKHDHRLSLYCPHCRNIINSKPIEVSYDYTININTEDDSLNYDMIVDNITPKMAISFPRVELYCNSCNTIINSIPVDYEISDIISRLNKLGFETVFSCAGHSFYSLPYIAFKSDVTKFIDIDKPPHWYWDPEGITQYNSFKIVIRADMNSMTLNEYREQIYLDELREYLDELEAE